MEQLYTFNFEKLEIWKEAIILTKSLYSVLQTFPSEETYGIVSQMKRASVSVASNIAEGSVRATAKEKLRFYEISMASLMELLNQLIISKELGFIKVDTYMDLRKQIEKISRMLAALKNSQLLEVS